LTPQVEANLFAHFRRFLPTKEQLGGRKILLLDYAQGGGSVVGAEEYVSKYLAQNSPEQKLEVAVLAPSNELPKVTEAKKPYRVISIEQHKILAMRLRFSWFKQAAEWRAKNDEGKFKAPYTDQLERVEPTPKSERGKLIERYQRLMAADPRLQPDAAKRKCLLDLADLPRG
jgi:hypothetical protein